MAEAPTLQAASAFPPGEITAPGVSIRPVEGLAIVSLAARRGQATTLTAKVQALFGLSLFGLSPPTGRPTHVAHEGLSVLGTGPDAWLALCADAARIDRLAQACEGLAVCADQSGAYGVLALEGAAVRDLLARGAAIDLDPGAFPEGASAAFAFSHFNAILWRLPGSHSFRLALSRSTAGDAWRLLAHIAAGLTACG